MKKSKLIYLLLLFICFACTDRREPKEKVRSIVIPVDRVDKPALFDSFFKMSRYIRLETTPECLIRKISKVVFYRENIYIQDSETNKISVFSGDGKYLKGIDHKGQGPGEYLRLTDFSIKDDVLYLLDRSGGKLLLYSLEDAFIDAKDIEKARTVSVLADGKYAVNMELGCADNMQNKQYYSYAYYEDSEAIHKDVAYNRELCGLSFSLSEGGNGFYTYSDSLFTLFPFNDTIYTVNHKDGRLSPYLSIKIGDKSIGLQDDKDEVKKLQKQGISTSVFSFYKLNSWTLFSYYYRESNRQYALVDANNEVLFNGPFGLDANKIPVRIIAYDDDKEIAEVMSVAYPFELLRIAKRHAATSDVLKQIATQISEEDNPILFFYEPKEQK